MSIWYHDKEQKQVVSHSTAGIDVMSFVLAGVVIVGAKALNLSGQTTLILLISSVLGCAIVGRIILYKFIRKIK